MNTKPDTKTIIWKHINNKAGGKYEIKGKSACAYEL